MTKHILIFLCLLLFSCKSNKPLLEAVSCPEAGTCSYEIYPNTSLDIKKDDTGSLYYQKKETQNKTLVVYYFQHNQKEAYIDGHYQEEVILELNSSDLQTDFQPQEPLAALFGVFCYCKGKAGYYQPKNIRISYERKTQLLQVELDEIIESQVLRSFSIKL